MNLFSEGTKKGIGKAITALKQAQCVFFDVDSTIIRQEGLDEFARFLGKYDQIKTLTNTAMSGKMTYVEAFEKRMNLLSPTQNDLNSFLINWKPQLTDGVKQFIAQLKADSKQIILISGGIYELILPVCKLLDIEEKDIYCNKLLFQYNQYCGFRKELPINQPNGKAGIIATFMKDHNLQHCVMIGDGATDLETASVVDCFIGYGGVIEREIVKQQASFFCTSFPSLLSLYCMNMSI